MAIHTEILRQLWVSLWVYGILAYLEMRRAEDQVNEANAIS